MTDIIAVDFDGTLCNDKFPNMGEANYRLISELKNRQGRGAKLILWTCRSGKQLEDALKWCRRYNLHFDAVNENLPEMVEKYGNDCRKVFATEYIDDKARKEVFEEL